MTGRDVARGWEDKPNDEGKDLHKMGLVDLIALQRIFFLIQFSNNILYRIQVTNLLYLSLRIGYTERKKLL